MTDGQDLLSEIPLFKLLDPRERLELMQSLERKRVERGSTVFSISEPGDALYIVASGLIEIFVNDTIGTRIVLAGCGPGEIFGELSLLDGGPRTASAVAIEDSELYVLDRPDLTRFLQNHPDAALDLLATMGQRIRSTDELLRNPASRNINDEIEMRSTPVERAADAIAEFSGSIPFFFLNLLWFVVWIGWNVLPGLNHFDPYPFGFLTMTVSLEAIFLSIFVLISQNRQSMKDRLRADAEYAVNLKAELEVAQLHVKFDALNEEMLARLPPRPR
ncbi:MAG TPA: DUF1003 domain-containing protein [Thermoanaerobaculia bacterium]|nr:DUF1003 domain-containing protein [Thermoanaerobaculia bacterium]